MFFLYQEASKIPNMTGLDLSLFYKKKRIYGTSFYHLYIQEHVLYTKVPEKCLLLL